MSEPTGKPKVWLHLEEHEKQYRMELNYAEMKDELYATQNEQGHPNHWRVRAYFEIGTPHKEAVMVLLQELLDSLGR